MDCTVCYLFPPYFPCVRGNIRTHYIIFLRRNQADTDLRPADVSAVVVRFLRCFSGCIDMCATGLFFQIEQWVDDSYVCIYDSHLVTISISLPAVVLPCLMNRGYLARCNFLSIDPPRFIFYFNTLFHTSTASANQLD